jgi:hypothetical protein
MIMTLLSALLASQLLVTVADRVPTFDVGPGCRASGEIVGVTIDGCFNDEKAAREQLVKEWAQFSGSAKTSCTDQTEYYLPSYVELLSCLEIFRDANKPYSPQE